MLSESFRGDHCLHRDLCVGRKMKTKQIQRQDTLRTNADLGPLSASSPGFPSCELPQGKFILPAFPGVIFRWEEGDPTGWAPPPPAPAGWWGLQPCRPPALHGLVGSVMLDHKSGLATRWPGDPANLLSVNLSILISDMELLALSSHVTVVGNI